MGNLTVWAPWGAGGNHLRWLLLLDKKFNFFKFQSTADKINYILTSIYPLKRTYSNWLDYEWIWRDRLKKFIVFSHPDWDPNWKNNLDQFNELNIFIESSNKFLPGQLYKKINPNFNGQSESDFAKMCEQRFVEVNMLTKSINGIVIDLAELYLPILSKNLYKQLTDYAQLDYNYDYASLIHERWFFLHNKAEEEYKKTNNLDAGLAQW